NMRRASINKRLSASINIGIINLAATFSSCLSRVSHPDCRATVLLVQRWILARLRHQRLFSLDEANRTIAALLVGLNNKPFKKL
ncbi:IS21 family transposase, partial [Paraburkholderia sp. NMBU_R16]|nr:IS21 family transposase [Paraburkholderia sp. NMBU_R16]